MKKLMVSTAFAALATGSFAGGLDRSGQPIGFIFEEGDAVQLSFGIVTPTVSSTPTAAAGDVGDRYTQIGFGIKTDVNEQLSFSLIVDQPFGANVTYPAGPLVGTSAELSSMAFTGVARYKFNENFSVHGGIRLQTMDGVASVPAAGGYTLDASGDMGVGFVVGAAYERPDIALRVALTYNSSIKHEFESLEFGLIPGTFEVEMPESINLDFQTGIAQDTLLFGSIRHAMWDGFTITPPNYPLGNLAAFSNDATSYSLGVGRRLNDQWSAAISFGYEGPNGGLADNLAPTDGNKSIGLGATYTMDDTKLSGGIRYIEIGDTTTTFGIPFTDNSAVAVGFSVTQKF